ncbi:MAG: hypothetical protein LIP05_16825 [Tannerellaceae bacterium]|nr:hypothetical protein [Tannerellaceae bacterium]
MNSSERAQTNFQVYIEPEIDTVVYETKGSGVYNSSTNSSTVTVSFKLLDSPLPTGVHEIYLSVTDNNAGGYIYPRTYQRDITLGRNNAITVELPIRYSSQDQLYTYQIIGK